MSSGGLKAVRVILALLVLAAVATQFHKGLGHQGFSAVNFFSFFTIIANLFCAAVLILLTTGLPAAQHRRDALRGAATFYLLIVGITFSALLAGVDLNTIPWVNTIVHYVMPLAMIIGWWIDPPKTPIRRRDAALWLPLLAVYVIYTLLRGAIVHWYPYPFMNAASIGYGSVSLYLLGMTVLAIIAAGVVMSIGNARRSRRSA